jgi:hypothetical protein
MDNGLYYSVCESKKSEKNAFLNTLFYNRAFALAKKNREKIYEHSAITMSIELSYTKYNTTYT